MAYSTTTGGTDGEAVAVGFVRDAHGNFLSKAETTLSQAQYYINQLANFMAAPTTVSVNFDYNGSLAAFQRPTRPTINDADFDLRPQDAPAAPPGFIGEDVDFGELPEFTEQAPVTSLPAQPVRPNIAMPVSPGAPAPLVMPDEPNYAQFIPDDVTLLSLNLPVFPDLQLPEFNAPRPALLPFEAPDTGSFTPEQYVSALLDRIKAKVNQWMDGEEVLPAAIRNALYDRARSRIVNESRAAEDQVHDDYAARGFSQPPGMLAARVDAIREKAQDQIAEASRELTVKEFDEILANMRLAMSTGVQLEGVTINLHMEMQRLTLASVQNLRDTGIAVLNARIAQFNAEMQGYQTDAQVFEARLRAELAELDVLRARIEAEKLKGDINEQTVKLYQAKWDAVKTMAEFYRGRVEAVKVQADTQRIPIDLFRAECGAYGDLMGAYAKEWDGFRSAVEAETAKVGVFRAHVDAFSARADSVTKMGSLKLDRERLRVQQHGQQLATYDASLRRLGQLLATEQARLGAVGQRAGSIATMYRADADVEQAASAAQDRTFELGLARAKAQVDAQLETARIRSQENVSLMGLNLEALKALAQIMAQLAASTMSAVNYSASVGASDSFSHSFGRSASWSGEAEDWNPSFV